MGWLVPDRKPSRGSGEPKKQKISIKLRRSGYTEHVVEKPLPEDWRGFTVAESLKASYGERSYYGTPAYLCQYYGAPFWYQERSRTKSQYTKRMLFYNLCCKGGQVYILPFKDPPAYLRELLRFDGSIT